MAALGGDLAAAPAGLEVAVDATPAEAIFRSKAMRRAADVLLRLKRAGNDAEGAERLQALAGRAVSQLEAGGEANWTELLGEEAWQAARVAPKEAVEALRGAAELFSPSSDSVEQVTVKSREEGGVAFKGVWRGEDVRLGFVDRGRSKWWGVYSAYAVSDGPAELLDKRLVDVEGDEERDDIVGGAPLQSVQPGDVFCLSDLERAAIKDIAVFDQLPDMARSFIPLYDVLSEMEETGNEDATLFIGGKQTFAKQMQIDDEVREAIVFWKMLENMPGDDARLDSRLRRLFAECTDVQELRTLVDGDDDLRELTESLGEPTARLLYNATRQAILRARLQGADSDQVTVMKVEVGPLQIIGSFVVVAVLIFSIFQVFLSPSQPNDSLPMYSLRKAPAEPAPQTTTQSRARASAVVPLYKTAFSSSP